MPLSWGIIDGQLENPREGVIGDYIDRRVKIVHKVFTDFKLWRQSAWYRGLST